MPKFYDPSQPDLFLEVPKFCGVFPIKRIVLAMQLLAMLIQIVWLVYVYPSQFFIFLQIISIVCNAFTFAVFMVENKTLMRAHYWTAFVFTIVPILFFLLVTINFFDKVFFSNASSNDIISLIIAIFFLCAYIFYILLCRKLIKAIEEQPESLPELDTTQGLFHFNRDAYDGTERIKLIYPEV